MKKFMSMLAMCFALTLAFLPSISKADSSPLRSVSISAVGDNNKMYSASSYLSIPVLKGDYLYVKVSEVGTPDSYSEALTVNGIRFAGSSLDEVSSYSGPFGSEKTFRLRIKDSYIFSNTSNSTNTITFEARVPFSMQVLSKTISVHVE
ncbi:MULTISPECIES: hypothetical protein [Bacillus]|uniref:Group-specific protein n=2 Tax=Bacillus wiedmannii TaxID=1890302 RepID=A0A2B5IMG4_9BACI|nr:MULTISPECIES: hypothetical protein [Bacillus]MDF9664014.1 hypothetical protein [Bacillus wiedmannii]MDI6508154.1 hypothetical protein [Bacillus wiedmannii]MDI6513927.1 hypothetical protein [Bacillus wiedmannii]PFZ26121.1 hypothetical protein COL51_16085 [Bacillus wiedmannii]PGC21479.1 hypothetical protein COM08_03660 [Bacillus wiedmannii]